MLLPARTISVAVVVALSMNATAEPAAVDPAELQLVGVIEKSQRQERQREPPRALLFSGLIGMAAYYGVSRSLTQTNAYEILNANGDVVSVLTDDKFAVGACVVIVPMGITPSNQYPYGYVALRSSQRCAEYGLAVAK